MTNTLSPEAIDFLKHALPWPTGDGYINLHWFEKSRDGQAKFAKGLPFQTIDEFAAEANKKIAQGVDLFVCQSRQSTTRTNQHDQVVAAKSQSHAQALKSAWLDLDVGPDDDNKYATVIDAIQSLAAFFKGAGLPRPSALVQTGGGVHAYWVSDRELTTAEWLPYATALREKAREHSLKCDSGITTDAARILRIPGSFNMKTGTPRPTKLTWTGDTYDFAALFPDAEKYKGLAPRIRAAIAPSKNLPKAFLPLLSEPNPLDMEVVDPTNIFAPTGCPLLRAMRESGGAEASQGMWNLTTLAATFMHNGKEIAHEMARGYSGYRPEETDALWDRKMEERRTVGLKWPGCSAFRNEGSKVCDGCPHWENLKGGPVALHSHNPNREPVKTLLVEEVIPVPKSPPHLDPPQNCFFHDGRLYKRAKKSKEEDDQGPGLSDIPIFHNQIRSVRVFEDVDGHVLHLRVSRDKDKDTDVDLKMRQMDGSKTMRSLMQTQFLYPATSDSRVGETIVAWVDKLNQSKAAANTIALGWLQEGEKKVGFAYGGKIFMADGTEQPAGYLDQQIKRDWSPVEGGELQPWLDCVNLVCAQKRVALEVLVAASLASPLMTTPGSLFNAYSTSGANKSFAISTGVAIWAHPKNGRETQLSTVRSVIDKLGKLKVLPLYWDEIRGPDNFENLHKTLFMMDGGTSPGRLNSNITHRPRENWQMLAVSASNSSFREFIENKHSHSDASHARVLEFKVPHGVETGIGQIDVEDAIAMMNRLEFHYGQAGLIYAKWLGQNATRAAEIETAWRKKLMEAVGRDKQSTERNWGAMIAPVLAGAEISNDILRTKFDIDAMFAFLVEVYKENRQRSEENTLTPSSKAAVMEFMSGVFNFASDRTMWTRRLHMSAGKPPLEKPLNPYDPKGQYKYPAIHWVQTLRLLVVSKKIIEAYGERIQMFGTLSIGEGLKQQFKAESRKVTPGAGTKKSGGPETCWLIPIPHGHPWEEQLYQYGDDDREKAQRDNGGNIIPIGAAMSAHHIPEGDDDDREERQQGRPTSDGV